MSFIIDYFKNIFNKKDLNTSISSFQDKINKVITDLIIPYAKPTELASNDRFRDLLTLLDSKQCNKIALTLSSNLDKNYTRIQLEQFASSILIGRDNTECKDETCSDNSLKTIDNSKEKVSKKSICNSIAVHYVKILNLIAAILTAVNPADNICLNRIRNLLTIINQEEQTGVSGICKPNKVVKNSIMNEPGFTQLLMLYYYHLMQDTETDIEKTNVRNQYELMVNTFKNLTGDSTNDNEINNVENNNYTANTKNINEDDEEDEEEEEEEEEDEEEEEEEEEDNWSNLL